MQCEAEMVVFEKVLLKWKPYLKLKITLKINPEISVLADDIWLYKIWNVDHIKFVHDLGNFGVAENYYIQRSLSPNVIYLSFSSSSSS